MIKKSSRHFFFMSTLTVLVLTSCSSGVKDEGKSLDTVAEAANPDSLLIVDCLLPGTIRQFGTRLTTLSARRAVKTSGADCSQRGGEYTPAAQANYASALKVWLPAAEAGDTEAEIYVGEIYEKGMGKSPNYNEANKWYAKAAAKGSARAKTNLGFSNERGLGTAPSPQKAIALYSDASRLGNNYSTAKTAPARPSVRPFPKQTTKPRITYVPKSQETAQAKRDLVQEKAKIEQKKMEVAQIKQQLQQAAPDPIPSAPTPTLTKPIAEKPKAPKPPKVVQAAPTPAQEALAKELQQREEDLQAQAQRVQQAEAELAALEKAKDKGETPKPQKPIAIASAPKAPKIEITEPPISALRSIGKPRIPLSNDSNPATIRGKIRPVKDIDKLLVNNQSTTFDSKGNFTANIPINGSGTDVSISAINTAGKATDVNFVLLPPEKTEVANTSASSKEPTANTTPEPDNTAAASGVSFGQYYAVVIGNANYTNHSALSSSVNDAEAVASVLKSKYGFKTVVLANASRAKMLASFDSLRNKLGDNDNLLIYYAGHGELADGTGYWLPSDASKTDKSTWISNAQVTNFIDAMKAKHILVVADSCYSGTLSQSSIPRPQFSDGQKTREWYQAVAKTKVRVVMSSGGVKPVLDTGGGNHSVFAEAFLDALNAGSSVLEGARLYDNLKDRVRINSSKAGLAQTPSFAPIRFAGHESGDFVLLKGGQIAFNDNAPKPVPEKTNLANLLAILDQRWLLGLRLG